MPSVQLNELSSSSKYLSVPREVGVHSASRSAIGTEWYNIDATGTLKEFVHTYNSCGQKLYQSGKPLGEWREVDQSKILYLYSGEQGIGLYRANGDLVSAVKNSSARKGVVDDTLYDASGKLLYHGQTTTLYSQGRPSSEAVVQIGPPPGKANYTTAPVVERHVEEADPFARPDPVDSFANNQPSPSDLVIPYNPPVDPDYQSSTSDLPVTEIQIETRFKPVTADVVVGSCVDRCGRQQLQIRYAQKVWDSQDKITDVSGRPSILLSRSEIESGLKEGEWRIVSNDQGVFRVKDGIVERQAVVGRENYRVGHSECRCVPVCGRFGRVHYQRQAVWVEQTKVAVKLGWVADPAVGFAEDQKSYGASPSDNGVPPVLGGPNPSPGQNPGPVATSERVPFRAEAKRVLTQMPEGNSVGPVVSTPSKLAQPTQNSQLAPLTLPESSASPIQVDAPQIKNESLDAMPKIAAVPTQVAKQSAPNIPPLDQVELEHGEEPGITLSESPDIRLPEIKPLEAKPSSTQPGPSVDPLPRDEPRPSLSDSPNGDPEAIPVRPWTPPKLEQLQQEKVAKSEQKLDQVAQPEFQELRMPERPKRASEQSMMTVLEIVGLLQQVEHFEEMAQRGVMVSRGGVDSYGLTAKDYSEYIAAPPQQPNANWPGGKPSYENPHLYASRLVSQLDETSNEFRWMKVVVDSLDRSLTAVKDGEILRDRRGEANARGLPDIAKMASGIATTRVEIERALSEIIESEMNVDDLLDWARSAPQTQGIFESEIQRLEQYRYNGDWKLPERAPEFAPQQQGQPRAPFPRPFRRQAVEQLL